MSKNERNFVVLVLLITIDICGFVAIWQWLASEAIKTFSTNF